MALIAAYLITVVWGWVILSVASETLNVAINAEIILFSGYSASFYISLMLMKTMLPVVSGSALARIPDVYYDWRDRKVYKIGSLVKVKNKKGIWRVYREGGWGSYWLTDTKLIGHEMIERRAGRLRLIKPNIKWL